MRPVEQTRLTPQEGGNCHAACIASILEVPLEEVPQLDGPEGLSPQGWAAYDARLAAWLAARNLVEVYFRFQDDWRPSGYTILGVQSVRFPGMGHSVVALDGQPVWDPHPDREQGLGEWTGWSIFQVLDPSRL